MDRIAGSKDILKPFFHKYQLGLITQTQIASELGISKQYISRIFTEFKQALDESSLDKRGRPKGVSITKNPESIEKCAHCQKSTKQLVLLNSVIQFLLLWIEHFTSQLGINYSPFKSRLPGDIKLFLLQSWFKYQELGGKLADFAQGIRRDPSTVYRWLELYAAGEPLEDKPSGSKKPPRVYPAWVLKAVYKLKKAYPLAENAGLAKLFNYSLSNPHLKLSSKEIKQILEQIESNKKLDKARRLKLYDFVQANVSWDIDFIEFTVNQVRRRVLVIIDHHSRKLLFARVMLSPTSEKVLRIIKALTKHCRVVPLLVKADNGPEFRNSFKQMLNNMGISLLNSPVYYPQFNGVVERVIREIRQKSHKFTFNSTKDIDHFLAQFQDYYNHQAHSSLGGLTPAQVYKKKCLGSHPVTTEMVEPYIKDGELRLKFTRGNGRPGRLSLPLNDPGDSSTYFFG